MYEVALTEWGLTPDYINANWTEELFALMLITRNQRIDRQNLRRKPKDEQGFRRLSNEEFFRRHNIKVTAVTGKIDLNARNRSGN